MIAKKSNTFILASILCGLTVTAACSRKIYIPIESAIHSVDTIKCSIHRIDSIYQRDSIFVASSGDTIIKEKYQWRIRDRIVRDTICKIKQDTVRITVVKEVPSAQKNKGSFLSRITDKISYWIICFLIILIFGIILKKYIRK